MPSPIGSKPASAPRERRWSEAPETGVTPTTSTGKTDPDCRATNGDLFWSGPATFGGRCRAPPYTPRPSHGPAVPETQPPTSPTDASAQPDSSQLALERTYLAAERTLFAVLRTGLSIVAGGTVIVTLLGEDWPEWVQGSLAGAFLVVGYGLVFLGLRRYHGIAKHVKHQDGQRLTIVPARTMSILTAILGITITIVLLLYFFSAFS